MRRSFGTRYADNQYEIYFNPEVIFADEATQVTIVDDKSSRNGLTKLELEDSFSSSQKGNSEKAYVYDDGTHGDTVKGDGVYTNNCITVAKTVSFNNTVYEKINKLLGKNSGLTYCEVRDNYEHFRSRCTEEKQTIFKFKKTTTRSKKEKGCTEPLYGKKSKCVINIVPQEDKGATFQMDKKCIKTRE